MPSQARRREDALVAQRRDLRATRVAVRRRRAPRLVGGEPLRRERRGAHGGTAASADASSPETVLARHGPLLDGKDRRAGLAVEHEELARLRRLKHDAGTRRPSRVTVDERRRRRVVVVPEVVVHGLEVPHDLARRRAQRDDGVRVAVVAEPLAAVVVGARAAGGDEHEVARGVGGDHRPRVRRAGACAICRRATSSRAGIGSSRCGTGSQVQRSAPVRASNARTSPRSHVGGAVVGDRRSRRRRARPTTAGGDVS